MRIHTHFFRFRGRDLSSKVGQTDLVFVCEYISRSVRARLQLSACTYDDSTGAESVVFN